MRKKALLTAFVITVLTGCTTTKNCPAYATKRVEYERGWDYRDYYPNTQTVYYYDFYGNRLSPNEYRTRDINGRPGVGDVTRPNAPKVTRPHTPPSRENRN